jgi:hypothetical protein
MRDIDVRPSDRTTLERLVADGKTPQKIVARARIVLLSGRGFGTNTIQRKARVSPNLRLPSGGCTCTPQFGATSPRKPRRAAGGAERAAVADIGKTVAAEADHRCAQPGLVRGMLA